MTRAQKHGLAAIATRSARVFTAMALAFSLGIGVSACGKRGDPELPPGAKKTDFPRPYPDPKSY